MVSAIEGVNAGDWLKWEEDNLYSREDGVLEGGDSEDLDLPSGLVLGKLSAGGNYVPLFEAGNDGSQTVSGILLLHTQVPDGVDTHAAVIVRDAVIEPSKLTWPSTYDGANITAGLATLKTLGIIAREGA